MTSTPAAPSLRNVSGKHSGAWYTLENKPWQSRGCWSKGNIVCKEFIGELFMNLLFYSKDLITGYQGWKRPEGHLVRLSDEETGRKQLHGQAGSWPESSCLLRPVLDSFLTQLVCSPSLSCPAIHILVRGGRLSAWRHVSNEMIL